MMYDVWDYSSDDFAGLVVNYGISNTWRGQGIHNQQWISMPPVTFDSVDGIDVAVIFKVWFPKLFNRILSWAIPVKLFSREFHKISMMRIQH